jgi:hypothetical protein
MNSQQRHREHMNQKNARKRVQGLDKLQLDLIEILNNHNFSEYNDAPKEIARTMKYLYQLLDQEFNNNNNGDNDTDSNGTYSNHSSNESSSNNPK